LREHRQRREVLPRENAELATEVARLEQEVRALRQRLGRTRTEVERAAPSLPDTLTLPFYVLPSRRTLYGRLCFVFRASEPWSFLGIFMGTTVAGLGWRLVVAGLFFLIILFLQGPENDESPTWSFDEEGFASTDGVEGSSGRVRYSELKKVEVRRGLLARFFGFGSVRVTWTPGEPMLLGKAVGPTERRVDIELLDEPQRLAGWLQARIPGKEAERVD
jgi:hypothetical protein